MPSEVKGFPYGLVVLASVLLPVQPWGCGFESRRCCSNPQMQKWNCFWIRTCPKEALTSVPSALTTRPRRHTKYQLTNRTCLSFPVSIENKKKIHGYICTKLCIATWVKACLHRSSMAMKWIFVNSFIS